MYIKPISGIPAEFNRNIKMSNNNLKEQLIDFYNSGREYGELIFDSDEYASSNSLYTGVTKAIRALEIPLKVGMIHGNIYIRRLDR